MFYIEIFLFSLLAINFFYRVINLFIKVNKQAYSENTKHTFRCSSCDQSYSLSGPEARKFIKGAVRINKSSPRNQTTLYKFSCPSCGKYSNQEKLFDLNTTKALGNLRVQMDSYQIPILIDFLLKGLLPILIVIPFLRFFIR
jgi:transcription elongation factor Elf1